MNRRSFFRSLIVGAVATPVVVKALTEEHEQPLMIKGEFKKSIFRYGLDLLTKEEIAKHFVYISWPNWTDPVTQMPYYVVVRPLPFYIHRHASITDNIKKIAIDLIKDSGTTHVYSVTTHPDYYPNSFEYDVYKVLVRGFKYSGGHYHE